MRPNRLNLQSPDIGLVQGFVASSFGIGVIRGMAPPGTLQCIWTFLGKTLDLAEVSAVTPTEYARELEEQTSRFIRAMPKGGRHWGMARKCLNLFFRDALYNFYLRDAYGLGKFESVLEIPLDSFSAAHLRAEPEGKSLPPWRSVVSLTPQLSRDFQEVASGVAQRMRTARVHLDVDYWRKPKPKRLRAARGN